MGALENQVALVTGGGKGIGRAVVDRFVAEGARVGVLVRSAGDAASLTDAHGDAVLPQLGDVRRPADHARLVAALLGRFGRLDTLVPNAAIYDFSEPFEGMTPEALDARFDELFAVNVKGYLFAVQAALPALRAARGSVILTLSSSSFHAGGGGVLYVAAKHALLGAMRQLAYEAAPEVRVNAVAPGATRTALGGGAGDDRRLDTLDGFERMVERSVPLGFLSTPEDHAGAYVMLAARSESAFMTATVIRSDGGLDVFGGGRRRRPEGPR
jgi:NAD(P)-dependent dehydrogenase (short-subunit alcohol dehydrogenase family)